MAEDKIRVSGKSPGVWEYKPKGKSFRKAKSIREFRGRDFVSVKIKTKKGNPLKEMALGKGYVITLRAK